MANTRTLQRSFAGGEISPNMFGRIDDVKYQSGAALMRNFIAAAQGPAENRPGFSFVREVKDSTKKTRLIPFTFSTTQTMVIELGAGYFRFHTQGQTVLAGSPAAWNSGVSYSIGDLVSYSGANYYCIKNTPVGYAPSDPVYWYQLPSSVYEVPNSYAEADLFDIHYVQSADVLTFVHPNYPPSELRRTSATRWPFIQISFDSTQPAPINVNVRTDGVTTPKYKYFYKVTAIASNGFDESAASNEATGVPINISAITKANPGVITTSAAHGLSVDDKVYIQGVGGMVQLTDGFYLVNTVPSTTQISLKTLAGVPVNTTAYTTYTSGGTVAPAYIFSNLFETGCTNTISWLPWSGATRYRVYKQQGGIYGYIGETDTTSLIDDNIAPDMGQTPPIYNNDFTGAGNYPGAVSYFEQRRAFAGTTNEPQKLWMTKSGTESNMSFSIPSQETDRIEIRVAAREANTIRHIVPLTQLILLTAAAEWRVTPIDSDALTPSSISVRPQSYIGANNVQPQIINNSLVYCAARGGHVRELGYSWQANGFVTGDLSLRATHLFDNFEIVDMAFSKAPQPLIWFVSDNGKLLGLTYIPEQQIGAWHQHDTDGLFESCAVVAEGKEDVLYVVVKRTIGGNTKRYIERLESRQIESLEKCFFVDSGLTYNGTNTGATTATVSGGSTWGPADSLTVTMSASTFTYPGTTNVGDAIVLTDTNGNKYRLTINSVSSATVATAIVDKVLPVALRNTATTIWALAIRDIAGLSHLEGKTVSILADGAVQPQQVVTSGTVSVPRAATFISVGLPYESDLQTLPVTLQIDGFGQGRYKNVNKAWLRVYQSSGIFVGPDEDNLVEAKQRTTEPYGTPPALKSQEIMVMLTPSWRDSGQVYVRQTDPLPLTVVSMTLEVSVGG